MKPDANIAKIQNDKRMRQHISQARGVNTSPEERNRQIEVEEKSTLDEAIKMTEISSDAIVPTLLDRLFGSPWQKGEYSICRCNVYFLYFTGRFESNKLSTAESVNIINLSHEEYENKLKQLLRTNQLNAFHNVQNTIQSVTSGVIFTLLTRWGFIGFLTSTNPSFSLLKNQSL